MGQKKGQVNKGSDKETLRQWTRQRDTQTMSQTKRYSVNEPAKRDTWTMDQKKGHLDNGPDEETGIQQAR